MGFFYPFQIALYVLTISNMKKILQIITFIFLSSVYAQAEGFRLGLEGGFSPVELEAEDTAQKIANASGSTVTTEYDIGVFVGRVFGEFGITSELSGEVGYFRSTSAEATYKIGSDSADESYEASGFDISAKVDFDGAFAKIGMHTSTLDGEANVTIGSTTYSATGTSQGTGMLFGAGIEVDDTYFSITRYNDIGGIDTALTMFSVGFKM